MSYRMPEIVEDPKAADSKEGKKGHLCTLHNISIYCTGCPGHAASLRMPLEFCGTDSKYMEAP